MADLELIAGKVIETAFRIHRELGPGLLESVYEGILARELRSDGLGVERQKKVAITYNGFRYEDGLTLDLLVEGVLIVEVKAREAVHPVFLRQTLTYLKAMDLPLGLLINFGGARLSDGLRRVVNHYEGSPSRRGAG